MSIIDSKEYMLNVKLERSRIKDMFKRRINNLAINASKNGFKEFTLTYFEKKDHQEDFFYDECSEYKRNTDIIEEIIEENLHYTSRFYKYAISDSVYCKKCLEENKHECTIYNHIATVIFEVIEEDEEEEIDNVLEALKNEPVNNELTNTNMEEVD